MISSSNDDDNSSFISEKASVIYKVLSKGTFFHLIRAAKPGDPAANPYRAMGVRLFMLPFSQPINSIFIALSAPCLQFSSPGAGNLNALFLSEETAFQRYGGLLF